jgi:hypothetical protein
MGCSIPLKRAASLCMRSFICAEIQSEFAKQTGLTPDDLQESFVEPFAGHLGHANYCGANSSARQADDKDEMGVVGSSAVT